MVAPNYLEAVASRSPGSAGFALDAARASWSYYIDNPILLVDAIKDILGGTVYDSDGSGKLARNLPKAHPQFPWMYAERVANIQGIGKPTTFNITESYETPLIVSQIALYKSYLLTIEFTPRPYSLVSDDNIPVDDSTYFDFDGASIPYKHTKEYVRFTDYHIEPDIEVVTANYGVMRFRGGSVNGKSFPGMPRTPIPKALIRFRWFGVPLRYIESDNSYLNQFQNCINQIDFWHWPAGSLLYRTYAVTRRYPDPVPDVNPVFGTQAFTPDKFCDLELLWEWTRRDLAAAPPAPINDNWIAAGHNLAPHFIDRKFYYVTADGRDAGGNPDPLQQTPLFYSVPFQILFTDPDV